MFRRHYVTLTCAFRVIWLRFELGSSSFGINVTVILRLFARSPRLPLISTRASVHARLGHEAIFLRWYSFVVWVQQQCQCIHQSL